MKILIVEDDQALAFMIGAFAQSRAKIVEVVGTWAEALSRLEAAVKTSNPFDLVVLDLNLPDSPSAATIERIPVMKRLGAKVMILTGSFLREVEPVAIAAGADSCAYKGNVDFVDWLKRGFLDRPNSKSPFARAGAFLA